MWSRFRLHLHPPKRVREIEREGERINGVWIDEAEPAWAVLLCAMLPVARQHASHRCSMPHRMQKHTAITFKTIIYETAIHNPDEYKINGVYTTLNLEFWANYSLK